MTTDESSAVTTVAGAAPMLQFFIQGNKTMVIRASPEDKVLSVNECIQKSMGIPISDQILTYRGNTLKCDHTLSQCSIQNDAFILVTTRVRSTINCQPLNILNMMIFVINKMCNGCKVPDASTKIQACLKKYVQEPDFQMFLDLSVPEKIVMLYMSKYEGNKSCGEECIQCLLNLLSLKTVNISNNTNASLAVLELCALLTRVGFDDPLYIRCRNMVFPIMKDCLVLDFSGTNEGLMRGTLRFLGALANGLLTDLQVVGRQLMAAFKDFKELFLLGSCLVRPHKSNDHNDFGHHVTTSLLGILFDLLKKMDQCLENMEKNLASENGREINLWPYFNMLKDLYHMSNLHGDAKQEFLSVLRNRRSMFCRLIIQYADIGDDHDWILEHKSVTDFGSRRHLVMLMFHEESGSEYELLIDRTDLLEESFENISEADPENLHHDLSIEFTNEVASGPGVLREWFLLVCQHLFNPQNALFMTCPYDQRRILPNSASKVQDDHHEYFKFAGRIIALALKHNIQVGVALDRVFFSLLAGKSITLQDIKETDPQYYSSCKHILEMDDDVIDSDALALNFTREEEEFGVTKVIELCQGGKSVAVNSKNRNMYVDLLIKDRFATSISVQVAHFARGFTDILCDTNHKKFFQSLELEDLDWMLYGGENAISVEDWKAHTEYISYNKDDPQIVWFWEIVERMPAEERRTLLFFWTSVKYLPVEGFRGLSSLVSIFKSSAPIDHLPSSHTCFYRLCLPPYPSMDVMEARLRKITQEHISFSFGDG